MSKSKYFLIPIDDITPEMIEASTSTEMDHIRKSWRPINKKMYGVLEFSSSKIPMSVLKYEGHFVEKTREIMRTREWNLTHDAEILYKYYSLQKVLTKFDSRSINEAYAISFKTIFGVLKCLFFEINKRYLDAPEKWTLFNDRNFEKSNESRLLDLCYFYNIISLQEKRVVHDFRVKRNDLAHSIGESKYPLSELRVALIELDPVITKYLNRVGL